MLDHAKESVPGARFLAPGHNFGSITDKISGLRKFGHSAIVFGYGNNQ